MANKRNVLYVPLLFLDRGTGQFGGYFWFFRTRGRRAKGNGQGGDAKARTGQCFFINGNEVEQSLMHLGKRVPKDCYNIICPTWELSRYPQPVIATGYSGNMDFMNEDNSFPVDYREVAVKHGEYPFAEGQVWADADIDDAVNIMSKLVENPRLGVEKGIMGRHTIERLYGFRQIGLAYQQRINHIVHEQQI